jgi:hypothetical protein
MGGLLGAANRPRAGAACSRTFTADHAVDLSRHRPRQGAGARPQHQRRLHRPAGDARRLLRQRLQPVRPHLAGQRAGRGADRATSTTSGRSMCATARHDGADALDRRRAHRDRPAGHHPLQQLPLDHVINGGPAPGVSSGQALAAMEQVSVDAAAGLRLRMDRHRLSGEEAPARPASSSALAMLFAYLFLVALYESWTIPIPVLLSVAVGVLGAYRGSDRRAALRPLRPDRPRGADRAGGQERHPDRRVRQGAARGRAFDRRGRALGAQMRFRAGDDDLDRLHPRPAAAGDRRPARR